MARVDFYEVLGVSRDATDEEIKKAYLRLVLEHHPDRNPGDQAAEARIREINAAYEILGDPEARRSYERLRFGDEAGRPETPNPAVILDEMEQKLYEEGRKEIFALLVKDAKRVKEELALIRERTVSLQGYDTFKEAVVLARAAEVMGEFVTPEMEIRRERLLDVALQMMVSQGVVGRQDVRRGNEIRSRFEETFRQGRRRGFMGALELWYVRK
jgi:molecular chaperone DnaJ